MSTLKRFLLACLPVLTAACTTSGMTSIPSVPHVDLPRYMGDWYVIAHIPSFIERKAHDAVESYELRADGRIKTTFRYRNGASDAPLKTMNPVGTVLPDTGNAVWGMEFIWPIQAEYVVAYVDPDYSQTIVGRSKRDYAWIMARSPKMAEPEYAGLLRRLAELGYDVSKVRRVPHSTGS